MSFVSFLKQFGLDVLKGVQILEGIAPVAVTAAQAAGAISTTTAGKVDTMTQMLAAALDVEQSFASAFGPTNPTGAAKFAALVPKVQQIVLDGETIAGKQVGDPALFTKAMQEYTQASVDLANSLKGNVQTNGSVGAPSVPPANLPVPPIAASPAVPTASATTKTPPKP